MRRDTDSACFLLRLATVCLLLPVAVAAMALPVRMYDADQLSSNLITSLCQDSQGYIWIGTEYGLNKFDGARFTHYYNDDTREKTLADNMVWRLLADRNSGIWVQTNRGVQYYDPLTDSFTTVTTDSGEPVKINDMLQANDGRVWLLRPRDGIWEVTAGNLKAKPMATINSHLRQQEDATEIYLDSKERLWVAYSSSGVQMTDLRTGASTDFEFPQSSQRAVDIAEDERQRLTVVTYSAVLQLNEQTKRFETVAEFTQKAVHRLYHDNMGHLLMGTSGSGLWTIDTEGRSVNPVSDVKLNGHSLSGERVQAYLHDRNGNQWIGCHRRGMLMVAGKPDSFHFLPISSMDSNNGNVLRAVFADSRHHVYVCQERGGITRISTSGRAEGHWLDDHTVTTMYEAEPGVFWVGTFRNGLFMLNTETGREQWIPLTGTGRISSITRDRQGNIYTAVFGDSLHSYTPDGLTERILGDGHLTLTNRYLNTLFTDRDGLIWIGHYYGIDVYDPATGRLVDTGVPPALRPAIVYAICQTPDGAVWVGSDKGLFRHDAGSGVQEPWRQFTTHDGMPNNMVCSLTALPDGTLWVSTYRGLARMAPDGTFTNYYRGNGLKEWSYLRGVSSLTAGGDVVLGHFNGITWFNPADIVADEFGQDIMLTGMHLGNDDVNATTLSGGRQVIKGKLETATDITVGYYDNTFSLHFSTMDFRDTENMHYEYRFTDEPKDVWHQTETGASDIFFTHLAAGKHYLQVRACDNGIYSPLKTLTLNVTPPWYRSTAAYIVYLLLIAAMVALWWRSYLHRRQAEINEEKIRLFVDLSHELRSPLTLIKSPLEELLSTEHDSKKRRALHNMKRNTRRLLTLVDQILSIRRIEKGQLKLRYAETPLGEFVGDICHDFDYLAEQRNIRLCFSDEAPDMTVWIDGENFDKVVSNLVGNAFKYVDDGGRIDVTVSRTDDGKALLCVSDNGQGIDEAQLKNIFDRFYQASARTSAGQMGYGIGLNLTQKLVAMHGGTVSASNRQDGQGAVFTVLLPLGCSHLPEDSLLHTSPTSPTPPTIPTTLTDTPLPHRIRKKTSYHIVVVDDDDELRQYLKTELGQYYHVRAYADGEKALSAIVDVVPDAVVSDVVMPGMDGFQLLKRLKANSVTSHVPVVLLTSKDDHSSRIAGLDSGADAYIGKPFSLDELTAQIGTLIANRQRARRKYSGEQQQLEASREIEIKGNDELLMERIMKAVNENLDDSDFNVEALAEAAGLSRVQLHRRMKDMTGMTVSEFIRNLRLQHAAKLLAKGDVNVSQVTYATGFSSPAHFSTAFKKIFGVTPTEYISRHASKA
ncbi:MAG: helix-turn-helix domain-containing protein [Prevotella sp.]|nr:helix-turn-helix domain-containing protein [Prevotella sp.]